MGTTTIRLTDESKERLDSLKRKGESYDDVIQRLTSSEDELVSFGALSDVDGFVENVEQIGAEFNQAIDEDIEEMQR
jgi:predicted CopG family antitoxin